MRDWIDLKEILIKQNTPEADIELVKEFLSFLSFGKRQQMLGVFLGLPDKLNFFIDLLKKKKDLVQNYNPELAKEILDSEKNEVEDLINQINL